MSWITESSTRSTSTGGCRSAGWRRSWALRSRRSPAATVGCATSTGSGWSASSTVSDLGRSDWAVRIRCTPDAATPVATALAKRPDTGWVQLTSGGTEISCMVNAHDEQRRAALLLEQLPASSRIVALEAFCLLHVFTSATSAAPGAEGLTPEEVDRLAAPSRSAGLAADRPVALLSEDDWPLVRASRRTAGRPTANWRRVPTGTSRRCVVGSKSWSARGCSTSISTSTRSSLVCGPGPTFGRQWHRRH